MGFLRSIESIFLDIEIDVNDYKFWILIGIYVVMFIIFWIVVVRFIDVVEGNGFEICG